MQKSKKILDYFLLYLLIGISSTPILIGEVFLVFGFVLTLIIFIMGKQKIDQSIFQYSAVFLILFIIHILHFGELRSTVFIAYFLRIFYAYFTIRIIGRNISKYYINIIFFFAAVSLIFWLILVFDRSFEKYLTTNITPFFYKLTYYKDYQHLIILTINFASQTMFPRNPGPFWEAGGFGVFLNLALLLNLIANKQIFNLKNIIIIIALLTTQSTGSYITFAVLIIGYLIFIRRFSYIVILLPVFTFVGWKYYKELSFLDEKIENQWELSQGGVGNIPRTRFGSAKEDMQTVYQYPLAGKGRFTAEVFSSVEKYHESSEYRNSGTTSVMAEFGIIGFLMYFITMFRSFKIYCRLNNFNSKFAIIVVIVMLVAGFSQALFGKPFFISLSFMFIYTYIKKSGKRKIYQKEINIPLSVS